MRNTQTLKMKEEKGGGKIIDNRIIKVKMKVVRKNLERQRMEVVKPEKKGCIK